MQKLAFITINRGEDWNKGLMSGLYVTEEGLRFLSPGQTSYGVFYTAAIDSREREFEWGRVLLEGDFPQGVMISVSAFASDNICSGADEIGGLLLADKPPTTEQISLLNRCYSERHDDTKDLLLEARGRYLWLQVELHVADGGSPLLNAIRVHYSGDHMEDYLPSIYREDNKIGFTHRFISAFNSMSLDLEDEIYKSPSYFDYQQAHGEMLRFLAGWVGVEDEGLSETLLRKRVRHAINSSQFSQTPKGIKELVKLWTGREPILLEYFQVKDLVRQGFNHELYERLYGTDPCVFFLLMEEDAFPTADGRQRFLKRLERVVPANIKPRLILLKRDAYLDWHTYLDVNSVIGDFSPAATDSGVSIHYDTMIGGSDIEKH